MTQTTLWLFRWRAFSAFSHRNFRLFFFGQLISVIGIWMQSTALQWLVYRITGSQTSLGMVTFINFLPVLVFSLLMGVVADLYPLRRLLIFTQTWFMVLAVILASLTGLGLVQYWHILLLSFLIGIGTALDMPARQAFMVEMVDGERGDVMNAVSMNSALFNLARIVGPSIAGAVIASLGEAFAFSANGISYLAVIFALFLMKFSSQTKEKPKQNPLKKMGDGFRYILSERNIGGLVILVALFSMVGLGSLNLLPVFAKDILNIGAAGFGHLLSWQGFGALSGALLLVTLGDRIKKGKMLFWSRLLLGPGIIGLALSRVPWVSMALMAIIGFSFITQLVLTNTLIQSIVPDELRGRVLSTYTWALGGFYPLGSLAFGALGDHIGAPTAALVSGIGCVGLILISQVFFASIGRLE